MPAVVAVLGEAGALVAGGSATAAPSCVVESNAPNVAVKLGAGPGAGGAPRLAYTVDLSGFGIDARYFFIRYWSSSSPPSGRVVCAVDRFAEVSFAGMVRLIHAVVCGSIAADEIGGTQPSCGSVATGQSGAGGADRAA